MLYSTLVMPFACLQMTGLNSYGMVLLEALQFNKPILVSNLQGSGMKWIASQTPLGQTFDCNNPEDLISKIANLAKPSTQQKSDLDQFSIESCQQRIDSIYTAIPKNNSF